MALAVPLLAGGWLLLAMGAYHLAATFLQPAAATDVAEQAIWELMFSFAVTSIAVLAASRASFLSNPQVRSVFLYSLVASSVLFLGYLATGALSWLFHEFGVARSTIANHLA